MKEMKEFFVFKNVNACLDHFIKKKPRREIQEKILTDIKYL